MRKLIFILAAIVCSHLTHAQISDEAAKQIYQDAEEQYEAGNFYKCYEICNELIVKMGKPTLRVLYLDLKAIYNNIERKNDKSQYHLKKSYKNFSKFSSYSSDFFSAVDKNNYPSDKYNEMVEIQNYLNGGMKQYAYEKDRKPEDAINFLNECAKKFTNNYNKETISVNFSLDSCNLVINSFGTNKSTVGSRYHKVGRQKVIIDLSKSWIDIFKYEYYKIYFDYRYFFATEFADGDELRYLKYEYPVLARSQPTVNENAPIIIGPKIFLDGKPKYSNITSFAINHFSKKLEFTDEEFEKDIKFWKIKPSDGFYIYTFFHEGNTEFIENNYKTRILDAFEFLFDYYGGGIPIENKTEVKNKF